MHRLRTVTSLDVSAVEGHHVMPAALLFPNWILLWSYLFSIKFCLVTTMLVPSRLCNFVTGILCAICKALVNVVGW